MNAARTLGWLAAPALGFASASALADAADVVRQLKAPEGFEISVWADNVAGARSMARGEGGTVFVGTRGAGIVYAVVPPKGDAPARVLKVASGLNSPNGVAVRGDALYVAEINRILRYDGIERQLQKPPAPVVVTEALPSDRHHGWKYIAFGPDGKLYVPVGAPCNVCESQDHALILRMNADGKQREVFARGVRNTVGFTWHPGTKELWFTDNGRDWLGDDRPSDELNRAPRMGMHFGFPFCHAGDVPDPEFGSSGKCSQATPPAYKLGAHVAALAVKFYGGEMLPAQYRGQMLIVEHGSWNRSTRVGYQLSWARLDGNRVVAYEPLVTGWNQPESVVGRPVDLLELPDGSLLVSDDAVGAIYRITYRGAG
ncbi:MAG TPA: PQQ-dependent sugar dehydrogenase [Steroidobacteraceae bacterium]|nr:PQQ-dependent sugar dehydrogenase [Steroidobacteraceae bacterium]